MISWINKTAVKHTELHWKTNQYHSLMFELPDSLRDYGPPVGKAPPQRSQSHHNGHQRHVRQNDQGELWAQPHPGWRRLTSPTGTRRDQQWSQGCAHRYRGGRQDGRQRHHAPATLRLHVSRRPILIFRDFKISKYIYCVLQYSSNISQYYMIIMNLIIPLPWIFLVLVIFFSLHRCCLSVKEDKPGCMSCFLSCKYWYQYSYLRRLQLILQYKVCFCFLTPTASWETHCCVRLSSFCALDVVGSSNLISIFWKALCWS